MTILVSSGRGIFSVVLEKVRGARFRRQNIGSLSSSNAYVIVTS